VIYDNLSSKKGEFEMKWRLDMDCGYPAQWREENRKLMADSRRRPSIR